MDSFEAKSEAEMREIGREFAANLHRGDVVALNGELGAGKTQFSKGLVAGLGGGDEVLSPTFAIVREYRSGEAPVFHFDWYRIESARELLDLGWEDYVEDDGVIIVEWAEKFPELLPTGAYVIDIHIASDGVRRGTVSRT